MICNETEFKNSDYGKAKIAFIVAQLQKNNIAISGNAFDLENLKSYYVNNITLVSPDVYNCYEALLNFGYEGTSKELDAYLKSKNPLGVGINTVGNTLDEIGNVLSSIIKNVPLVLALITVIVVTNAVKK